jgi:cytochrome c-type biogenesis protein CcmH/NrfG
LFREALHEYLQGSWFEAEAKLGHLLRLDPRDVEGRLLLATLLRHNERHAESIEHLDRLSRLRGADRWSEEIAAERRAIAEAREPAASNPVVAPIAYESRQAA